MNTGIGRENRRKGGGKKRHGPPLERCSSTKEDSTRLNTNAELMLWLEIQRRNRATTEDPSALHATRRTTFRIWMMAVGMMLLLMAPTY